MIKHYCFTLLFITFCLVTLAQSSPTKLFVATNGNDKNEGSIDKPFATLTKARDAVRKLKSKNGLPSGGIEVLIRGGNYPFNSSLELTADDAGEAGKPIAYKAYKGEKVHFNAGTLIDPKSWKPLDKEATKRVNPKVDARKLVALDLSKLNFTNASAFAPVHQFTTDWYIIDLYANNKRQPISQWPNPLENIRGKNDMGYITCNGSRDNVSFYYGAGGSPNDKDSTNELDLDGSNRAERWKKSIEDGHELWLKGLWRTPWAPKTMLVQSINTNEHFIQFVEEPGGGMGSKYAKVVHEKPTWTVGNGRENWFAINYLDEIDQPGEWALDFKDKKIYYYPPAPINQLEMRVSDMKQPIINFKNTAFIQVIGITMEVGLSDGMTITNSNNLQIAGCNITNVGNSGIAIEGGKDNIIQSNDLSETAGFGIELKNIGNRKTLTSGNTVINNNHIHHVGKLAYKQAISISKAVGIVISHNLLHDIPTAGIRTDDINNCTFEYNEIHNIALKESDNGVFYNYGGWSTYGNVFRYNFSHHTNRSNGCYSDDGTSGDFYFKNIVQGCITGVVFGGGHDNLAENNLFIESKQQSIDDRGKDRNYRLGTSYEKRLAQFNVFEEPWKSYGEKLKADYKLTTNLWGDVLKPEWHPEYPNGCRMVNNVGVASGKFKQPKNGETMVSDNDLISTVEQAGFYNYHNMDLRTKNPIILAKFPELNEVFPMIGLQKDAYRKTIPTRAETGGLANRGSEGDMKNEDQFTDKVVPTKK